MINSLKNRKSLVISLLFFTAVVALLMQGAWAAAPTPHDPANDFKYISDTLNTWLGGYLGKAIAVGGGVAVLVILRFSTIGWIAAIGVGIAISQLPKILIGLF